jgi:hypothetical protein
MPVKSHPLKWMLHRFRQSRKTSRNPQASCGLLKQPSLVLDKHIVFREKIRNVSVCVQAARCLPTSRIRLHQRLRPVIGSDYIACTKRPIYFVRMSAMRTNDSYENFIAILRRSFDLYPLATFGTSNSFNHFLTPRRLFCPYSASCSTASAMTGI